MAHGLTRMGHQSIHRKGREEKITAEIAEGAEKSNSPQRHGNTEKSICRRDRGGRREKREN